MVVLKSCIKEWIEETIVNTKILACYLPQFHEIPENNEWWGKGFTEWTNVKKAKPLYNWHKQPKKPLNDNYYNLLDKDIVEWQTALANKYGLYGFCYFHYYFQGKLILEKPAENLLRWRDIDQRFCFFWANVTWSRTWTAAKNATTWVAEGYENKTGKDILLEQTYGSNDDWIAHFKYLLPFFKDERYIKVNGKPMFYIYKISDIDCINEMLATWDALAQENGLPGMHIVAVNDDAANIPGVEAIAHYGLPKVDVFNFTLLKNKILHKFERFFREKFSGEKKDVWDYQKMWDNILSLKPYGNVPNYPSALVGYDDTPRRGENGVMLRNQTPELFEKNLKRQLWRAKNIYRSDYLLLTAWNEWGEGNYLEPDVECRYEYLERLQAAISTYE